MILKTHHGQYPSLHPQCRGAANAVAVGQVLAEADVNIWYGAVIRGDASVIRLRRGTNIQDNAVLHGTADYPVTVGADVTVGHGAILHGCTIEDGCLIGMGAILLNGCQIGQGCLVAAGALVPQGQSIPPNSLVVGSPAKVVRSLRPEEQSQLQDSAVRYRASAAEQLPLAEGGGTAG